MLEKLKSKLAEKAREVSDETVGIVKVDELIRENRFDICKTCDQFHQKSQLCKTCGCYIPAKTWLKSTSCPLKKW